MSGWFDSLDPELRELVRGFEAECQEHVQALSEAILGLVDASAEARPELVARAFRATHSVKGGAAALQMDAVSGLAHAMETLLAGVRKSGRPVEPEERELLLAGGDALLAALRGTIAGTDLPPTAELVAALGGDRRARRREPTVEPLAEDDRLLRVELAKLDELASRTSDLLVARSQARERSSQAAQLAELAEALHARLSREKGSAAAQAAALGREAERLQTALSRDALRMGLLSEQLLEAIQGIRLTPLSSLFGVVRRAAHDAARRVEKEIEIELSGEHVELDKQVLDALKDPLVHLVRNAVDHGLEPTEARAASRKPPKGKVSLRGSQVGDRVVVEVADDGRGVDFEALKRAAVRSGARTQGDVDALPPDRALELMTLPGLSTREEVGELSGRGVGLDVVRRNVETGLHGSLAVRSQPGQGTTFTLVVPISIATVTGLVLELEGRRVAVLASAVERVVRLADADCREVEERPVLAQADGSFVEIVDLAAQLGLSSARRRDVAAVLSGGERRVAFAVDGVIGERQLVFRPLWPPLHRVGAVIGGAVLEGDEPLVVLGSLELLSARRSPGVAIPVAKDEAEEGPELDVLVVDDSITTRTLETNILRKHGCRVRSAVDGEEALREIRRELPAVLVSDVEMPRMDGLSLCRAIRSDPALAALPIILVTSLSSPEERAAGLDAGADAYVEKGSFDQERFLATLKRLARGR